MSENLNNGPTWPMRPTRRELPPLQVEDYEGILKALTIIAWAGLGMALALELWIRLSKRLIWPQIGGFSKFYNGICIEYGVTNLLLTYLLWKSHWLERFPRRQIRRLRYLLAAVLVRDGLHLLGLIHVSGSTGGPMIAAIPCILIAMFLLIPRKGAFYFSAFFIAGYITIIVLEDFYILESPGLLVSAFDLEGVGVIPGAIVLLLFSGASLVFGHFGRKRLDAAGAMLYRDSVTDALTNLYDAEFFLQRLGQELGRADRQGDRVALVMFEVSNYLEIARNQGQMMTDQVLEMLGDEVRKAVRLESDSPARYSNSTFAILLPGSDEQGGKIVAARLQKAAMAIPLSGDGSHHVQLAVGVAGTREPGKVDPMEMLEAADQCLLESRRAGDGNIRIQSLPSSGAGESPAP